MSSRCYTALLLEPTSLFYEEAGEKKTKLNWNSIRQYIAPRKMADCPGVYCIIDNLTVTTDISLLTQSLVDTGIHTQNLPYITIVLIAQLMLVFSRSIVDFIRTRILLQVSSLVNLSILSDFWIKLTHLPINYFDSHHTGDTLQRLDDHRNIQNFLTGPTI